MQISKKVLCETDFSNSQKCRRTQTLFAYVCPMYKEHSCEYIPVINTYWYGDVLMSNFYYKSLEIL